MLTVDVTINQLSNYSSISQLKHTKRTDRNPRLRGISELSRMCFNLDGQYRAGTLNIGDNNGNKKQVNLLS